MGLGGFHIKDTQRAMGNGQWGKFIIKENSVFAQHWAETQMYLIRTKSVPSPIITGLGTDLVRP